MSESACVEHHDLCCREFSFGLICRRFVVVIYNVLEDYGSEESAKFEPICKLKF
jgi:hypothetical protein